MSKREFKATEGLLHDVMRKQAGSIEKAILEAVMNSVDANSEFIEITIRGNSITISDDGDGMATEEVERYFEKFGLKDDDIEDKDFGKFRMGRGQIFNFGVNVWHSRDNVMVVDLNNDEATITVDGKEYHLDTSGLSYNLIKVDPEYAGCKVNVDLYNPLDDIHGVASDVKDLIKYIPWMHDVEIFINEDEYWPRFDPDVETENACYKVGRDGYSTSTLVYNQGAFVTSADLNQTGGIIISKKDLDVNFARNDILDTCPVFSEIEEEWTRITREHLVDSDDLTEQEKKWLLQNAINDEAFLVEIHDKPLIPDATGGDWSINQLRGEKVTFAVKGSALAEKVMEHAGIVPVKRSFEDTIVKLIDNSSLIDFEDAIESDYLLEMKEYDDDQLSKKRRENLARARFFLERVGFNGGAKGGYSEEREVWKNDENTVVIHKDVLKRRKHEFLTMYIFKILEAAAHEGSMRESVDHDFSFRRNFWQYAENAGRVQYDLLELDPEIEEYLN